MPTPSQFPTDLAFPQCTFCGIEFESTAVNHGRPSRAQSASLDRDLRLIEETYGVDHLDLVLAKGYLTPLFENPRVAKYLREHRRELALEFIRNVERQATAARFRTSSTVRKGTRAHKRGDRRRRRTVRRIKCGGGEGGEPALSPPGWKSYASRQRAAFSPLPWEHAASARRFRF